MDTNKEKLRKTPLVSVCMVTYNRANFLPEAIESVLAQTFADWEMIIIDDASDDNTKEVVERYCAQDTRIHYYFNKIQLKISESRNRSLSYAKGKFVAILDSDDVWCDPFKLKEQCNFLDTHPDYVIIGSGVVVINKEGNEIRRYINPRNDKDIRKNIYWRNPFAHSSVMYRHDTVVKMGGYDVSLDTAEDYDLFLRLGQVGKLANSEKYLIKYCVHDTNITITDRVQTMQLNISLARKYKGMYPFFYRAMVRRITRLFAYRLLSFLRIM